MQEALCTTHSKQNTMHASDFNTKSPCLCLEGSSGKCLFVNPDILLPRQCSLVAKVIVSRPRVLDFTSCLCHGMLFSCAQMSQPLCAYFLNYKISCYRQHQPHRIVVRLKGLIIYRKCLPQCLMYSKNTRNALYHFS